MRMRGTRRSSIMGLSFVALAMSGCATMNRNECAAVDWQTIGYEDGVAGYSGDRIAEHRKACARYHITPDLGLYRAGRDQGLQEYCRPQNGFRIGARGGVYSGVCPGELESAFVGAYESGRQLYALESRASNAANHLNSARRELEHVEHEIVEKSAVIVSGESSSEDRAHALVSTQQLAERAGRLKAEIVELERDKLRCERDLEDYRATNPPSG
jgi:hypothetical protein